MLTLYHAPTTRSFRIYWLLEELGIPYERKTINYYGDERHSPEFRALNPLGSFPMITDDDFVLIESGAIINYILRKYGNGRFQAPAGSRDEALIDQWMYWSESLPAIHQRAFWDHCAPPPGCGPNPIPELGREGKRAFIKTLDMLERDLRDDGFVVGDDLTGADFMLSFPLFLGDFDHWLKGHPKTKAYLKRMAGREKFKVAVRDTIDMCMELFPPRPREGKMPLAAQV